MNPTPKQIQVIRVAMAELEGWKDVTCDMILLGTPPSEFAAKHDPAVWSPDDGNHRYEVPDYTASLDAVHAVEKMLTGPQWDMYTRYLDDIGRCGDKLPWQDINPSRVIDAYLVHANATDKCIALLMTVAPDKWEEIQNLKG